MSLFEPSRSPWTGRMLSVYRVVVLAGEMAVAYFQFHAPESPFPTVADT